MKYFHSLIITGFLIPFLSLNAEISDTAFLDQKEEASLTSLDEELSLLDEEFEEFKEELYSLENDLQKQEKSSVPILEKSQDEVIALKEEAEFSPSEVVFDSELLPGIQITQPIKELAIDASKYSLIEKANLEAESFDSPAVIEKVNLIKESMAIPFQIAASEEEELGEEEDELSEDISSVQGTALDGGEPLPLNDDAIAIDIREAFAGSPIIYSLLFAMSLVAASLWLYSIFSVRLSARLSQSFINNLKNKLTSNSFEEALHLCEERNTLFCKMIASGIHSRRHGLPVMIEAMKAEGKRASIAFWQKIGLLNDIAIIAPMLGLLGTVLGMFYAFYNVNRSIESISTLFDGLGISVGTTVAGLVVAIVALILHSTAKYRLVRALALVENEAQRVATLIDDRTSIYKGPST